VPLKKKVTDQFVYLSYIRKDFKDFDHFKRELENMLSATTGTRDLVIDFTGSTGIVSSEIGLLVRLVNLFKGSARYLRIVGSDKTLSMLKSTNIQNLENIMMYEDQKQFFDEVKKLANK
jgi:anti-anti-sigma regulatory factor